MSQSSLKRSNPKEKKDQVKIIRMSFGETEKVHAHCHPLMLFKPWSIIFQNWQVQEEVEDIKVNIENITHKKKYVFIMSSFCFYHKIQNDNNESLNWHI